MLSINKKFFVTCFLILTSTITLSTSNYAQANSTINFQSKIVVKSDGTNISTITPCVISGPDTCDFQVRIYDQPTGGTLLFQETHNNIELGDTAGVFNLLINSTCGGTWLSPSAPCSGSGIDWGSDPTLYIEIEFDPSGTSTFSGIEVFNRKLLTSVPFSYYSDRAGGIVGGLDTVYSNDNDKILNINHISGLEFVLSTSGHVKFSLLSTGDMIWNAQSTDVFTFNNLGGFEYVLNSVTNPNISVENQGSSTSLVINENGTSSPDFIDLQVSSISRFRITNDGRMLVNVNGNQEVLDLIYNTSSVINTAISLENLGTGAIEVGIDLSDSNINNALSLGNNNIQIFDGGRVSFNDTLGNQVLQIIDGHENFGGIIESGAFVNRNSYFGEEWSRFRSNIAPATSSNAVWGDFQAFSVWEEGPSGTRDCTFGVTTNGIGGLGRITNVQANTTCNAFHGISAVASNLIFRVQNLPLIMVKLRPSSVAIDSNFRVGISDNNTPINAEPANGVYFTNVGGVWTGVTRSASMQTNVTCSGQTISTTNFASFKIEVLSPTNIRFYVDNDMSNGLQWFECGSSSTNIPSVQMTSMIRWTGSIANSFLEIDHFRIWQDDTSDINDYDNVSVDDDQNANQDMNVVSYPIFDDINNQVNNQPNINNQDNNYTVIPLSYIQTEDLISISPSYENIQNMIFNVSNLIIHKDMFVNGTVSIGGNLILDGDIFIKGKIRLNKQNFIKIEFAIGEINKTVYLPETLTYKPFVVVNQTIGSSTQFFIEEINNNSFVLRLLEPANENLEFEALYIEKY